MITVLVIGYLSVFCDRLLSKLDSIPGDRRTMIGFIAVDSGIHFYQFSEGCVEPNELIVTDLDGTVMLCVY